MSDYRPTKRPVDPRAGRASSSAPGRSAQNSRRPAQGSRQGQSARPASPNGRPPKRRNPRVSGRFYLFLAILFVVIVGIVLIIAKPWKADPVTTLAPGSTDAVTAQPGDDTASPDATPTADPASLSGTALAQYLGQDETDIAGLTADQMVSVSDLSINQNLPSEWKNILLLGVDQRSVDESARSDTMIVCSINTNTGEVKLCSIMRDLAVEYTDLGENNGTYRINAANYFGGPQLAMKTVNECFDLNIENYVEINFFGFQKLAEALGGITIDITEDEMNQINKNAYAQAIIAVNAGVDESDLAETNVALETYGENTHLNGRQTLAYARIRKIDSDFSRAERQRKVLLALMEQIKGKSAIELATVGASVFDYFKTNMTLNDILSISIKVLEADLENIEQFRLPVNGTYTQETRNAQSMFYDCDMATNALQLYNFIYE